MNDLNPQQKKALRLARILDGNKIPNGKDIAIAKELNTLEDKIDSNYQELSSNIDTVANAVSNIQLKHGENGQDGYTPIKGVDYEDGHDYVLTEIDKKEIASQIKVPIVDRIIEKTIVEQPIIKEKETIKETIREPQILKQDQSGEEIVSKINDLPTDDNDLKIDASHIKNLPKLVENVGRGFFGSGSSSTTVKAGSNVTVTRDGTGAYVVSSVATGDLTWSPAPVEPTDTATAGEIAYDTSYFYVAVATNTWKRTALSTWSVVEENFLLQDGSDFLLQ